MARELGIDGRQQQQILDEVVPVMRERHAAMLAEQWGEWVAQAKADDELADHKGFDHNLSLARKALQHFGTPALSGLLDESGLGDHPEVLRFMKRVGMRLDHLKEG